ncbi:unnamed protein product [Brassica rapa subsp. trilocularis]
MGRLYVPDLVSFCWVRLLDGNLLCRHLLASSAWCEMVEFGYTRVRVQELLILLNVFPTWSFKVLGHDWRPGAVMVFGLSSLDH